VEGYKREGKSGGWGGGGDREEGCEKGEKEGVGERCMVECWDG